MKEAQNHINSILLSKAGVHIRNSTRYITFTTPDLRMCPDCPSASTSPIRMDGCITHKVNVGVGQQHLSEGITMHMQPDIMP